MRSVTSDGGFQTCADVASAGQEGALVLYTTDPEGGAAKLLAGFQAAFPPDYGRAAALGLSPFGAMVLSKFLLHRGGVATTSGKGFRPRAVETSAIRWPLLAIAWGYVFLSVLLPLAALLLTSF